MGKLTPSKELRTVYKVLKRIHASEQLEGTDPGRFAPLRLTASPSSARKTSQKRSTIPTPRTQSSSIARGWHFTTPLKQQAGRRKCAS